MTNAATALSRKDIGNGSVLLLVSIALGVENIDRQLSNNRLDQTAAGTPGKGRMMIFPASGDKQLHRYKLPTTAWFEYHCLESEESADAEIWRRTHQKVTVLRMLTLQESDYEMYEVRFADGLTWHVFADELMRSQKQFERPDYQKAAA